MSIPAIRTKARSAQSDQKQKNSIETPVAKEIHALKEPRDSSPEKNEKVHFEFPYDDLELLYEYTLQKMGITDPFKSEQKDQKKDQGDGSRDLS